VKKITIATNFNNKLSCSKFVHLAEAPEKGIAEKHLRETTIEITTEDGSHPPVQTRLVDLCRLPLYQLTNIFTYQSHGMTSNEFVRWFEMKNRKTSPLTAMALYYYEKI
jgi:hypothetical protein